MAPATELIAGRYELRDVLGRGGMGVVYRGRDHVLDRVVAIKILPAQFASEALLVERFEREARAAARLNHPNIVAVFDTGHEQTVRYIVMECVAGESLAQRLGERGRLPVPEAVDVAAQIADALAAAHAAGIVHRDIKPGNVMVEPTGTCKVLDFGIARAAAEAALTQDAAMLGSAPYMSPETALGRTADARSDIYSLGCVLYEMLTGRLPFYGEVAAAVINQHVSAVPPPPRELEPSVPAALDGLVMRMLAKDPADRPQDARRAAADLRASLDGPSAPELIPDAAVAPTLVARTLAAPRQEAPSRTQPPPPPRPGRFPVGLFGVAALVALLVGIGIALAASSGSGDHTTSAKAPRTAPASTSSHSTAATASTTSASSTVTPSTSTSVTTVTLRSTSSDAARTSSQATSTSSATSASSTTPTTTR